MRSGAFILGIIGSTLLLAAGGVLYSMAGSGSGQLYRASMDGVRPIEQLSSSWSVEIARVPGCPGARSDIAAAVSKRLGDVPGLFASRTEIRLLLAQVIENSVRAVQGLEDRKATIKIDTAWRNKDVLITVVDNGGGITPDRRRQIFRPFYTSRNGAMGLGLTLAGHLVKKYEGGIRVNSLPGQGTVTRITLPTGIPGP